VEKGHISVTFLLITFFGTLKKFFFTDLRKCELQFFMFFFIFSNIFFKDHISTFSSFECQCTRDGSEKLKTFLYKHVLEFSYATINGLM
jgi:hypothetical protein